MTNLALQWRPQRLSDVVGQRPVRALLTQLAKQAIEANTHTPLLFYGPKGCGKTSCGRVFAAALNAPDGHGDVDAATFTGSNYDLVEIDAASHGGVDDVRALQQSLQYRQQGQWRVVLLDEAHSMSNAAFNALLKTLEEPPDQTLFILLTTEPYKILPTVMSRCMPVEFRKVGVQDIFQRLIVIADSLVDYAPVESLLEDISTRADGSMRDAVLLLDQCSRIGISTKAALGELLGESEFAGEVLDKICEGDAFGAIWRLDEELKRTGDGRKALDDLTNAVVELFYTNESPSKFDAMFVLRIVKPLWDLRANRPVGTPGAALRHAVAVCAERGAQGAKQVPKAQTVGTTESLADMQDLFQP